MQGFDFDEEQYDVLRMTSTDTHYETVPRGKAWSDKPYGEVEGNIEGIGHKRWKVHAVLGKGDCMYLALAITVFKLVGHLSREEIIGKIGNTVYGDRLFQVAECGRSNVEGKDLKGNGLRKLLASHVRETPQLEQTLKTEQTYEPTKWLQTRGNKAAMSTCEVWFQHTETAGNYWNDGTEKIWKSFLGESVLLRAVCGNESRAGHFKLELDTENSDKRPPFLVFLLYTSPAVGKGDYCDRGDKGHFHILLEVENDQHEALATSAAAAPFGHQSPAAVNAASVARCVDLIWLGRAVAHSTLRPFKGGTRWFFPGSQVLFPL